MYSTDTANPQLTEEQNTAVERREFASWQRSLRPFMSKAIVLLAVVFFSVSCGNLLQLQRMLNQEPSMDIRQQIQHLASLQGVPVHPVERGLLVLEADTSQKRRSIKGEHHRALKRAGSTKEG